MAKSKKKSKSAWHAVPLKNSFMAIAIIGFLVTAYMIYPSNSDYGIAFMLLFAIMFIAAFVSMSKTPIK